MSDARVWLDALIGEWDTTGTHPLIKETIRGHASFEWLAGHTFLIWRGASTPEIVPTFISVLGDVTAADDFPLHYFDARGVARVYTARVDRDVLRFWRDHPGFSQRATVSIDRHGDVVAWRTELNEHGGWKPDLEMTYKRRETANVASSPGRAVPR